MRNAAFCEGRSSVQLTTGSMTDHFYAHPSAVLDEGASVGPRTSIWHFVHVSGGAKIGENCSIGQGVFVGNDVVIGNRCKIQNNVSIYDSVSLEDDVFCGPSAVFTNVLNPRAHVQRKSEYKKTVVRRGATLGANCTVVCGVTIGEYAFVGAGAVVVRDVQPYALVVGNPARQIGWMSQYGERIPLPLSGEGQFQCPHTRVAYELRENSLMVS